jgi:hypothetical protein
VDKLTEHETGEGDKMSFGQHRGQSLVVTRQAAKAAGPGEAAALLWL